MRFSNEWNKTSFSSNFIMSVPFVSIGHTQKTIHFLPNVNLAKRWTTFNWRHSIMLPYHQVEKHAIRSNRSANSTSSVRSFSHRRIGYKKTTATSNAIAEPPVPASTSHLSVEEEKNSGSAKKMTGNASLTNDANAQRTFNGHCKVRHT
jgi:hypothetical protein